MPYIGKYIGRPQRKKAKLMKLVPFKSIAAGDCGKHYDGLSKRTRRPYDRGVFTDGRSVQPTGISDDTGKGEVRNGERKGQGCFNRTSPHNGG